MSTQSGLTWSVDNTGAGATLDLFFSSDPLDPTQTATFSVHIDNTADERSFFGILFYPTQVPECGNDIVESGEECDDGNNDDGDCCSSSCQLESSATVCRATAGPCDVEETCTGTDPNCPVDGFEPGSTECRGMAGDCDVAENCTGTDPNCPADAFEPDMTSCNDGDQCTLDDECQSGSCVGDPETCGDGTVQGSCGEECDDGNNDDGDGCSADCQLEGEAVPVLSDWCIVVFAALLLGIGWLVLRREHGYRT
jgi:cysteine-rich repeat protein